MADLGKINQGINRRWFQTDPGDPIGSARALFSTVRLIQESQKSNTLQDMVWTRMYGGRRAISGLAFASAIVDNVGTVGAFGTFAQPNHNLIYSAITTINSKLTKEQPRIEVIPDGGDYLITRQAEKLQQYIDGWFYDVDMYAQTKMASKTALILGTGAVKLWHEDGRLCAGAVFTPNLHIDTVEGDSRNPRSIFQDGLMDRFLLARQFPDREQQILAAKPFTPAGGVAALIESNVNVLNSMVLVEEGWHLESQPGAGDGRHILAIEGMTLVDEPWTLPCFPFVFFRFDNNPIGFYGRGVAELLTGHQLQLTRVLETEAMAHDLFSVPKVWIEKASDVNPVTLQTNYPGTVGFYSGTMPQMGMSSATSPDFVAYRDWIIGDAMEFLGLSQISATGAMPPQMAGASGVAIREVNEEVADRWAELVNDFERMHVELVELASTMMQHEGGQTVLSPTAVGSAGTKLKWSDVKMRENCYVLRPSPASQLPDSPGAKRQFVTELLQAGLIDQDTALDLLNMPDIKSFMDLRNAGMNHLKEVIYKIIVDGDYSPPDELDNLALGVRLFTAAYQHGLDSGVPEANLKMLRRWIGEAKALTTPPTPPPGAPPAPGGAPIAKGAPPPASPLLPFGAKPGGA